MPGPDEKSSATGYSAPEFGHLLHAKHTGPRNCALKRAPTCRKSERISEKIMGCASCRWRKRLSANRDRHRRAHDVEQHPRAPGSVEPIERAHQIGKWSGHD